LDRDKKIHSTEKREKTGEGVSPGKVSDLASKLMSREGKDHAEETADHDNHAVDLPAESNARPKFEGEGKQDLPIREKVWEEFERTRKETSFLKDQGANTNAISIRLNDGFKALKDGKFKAAQMILSNCRSIIKRLEDGIKIKNAQQKLSKARQILNDLSEMDSKSLEQKGVSVRNFKISYSGAKTALKDGDFDEAIELSEILIEEMMSVRDSEYINELELRISDVEMSIRSLEKDGIDVKRELEHLQVCKKRIIKRKYHDAKSRLNRLSDDVAKRTNDIRMKKAINELSILQGLLVKLDNMGVDIEDIKEMFLGAQNAFYQGDYPFVSKVAREGALLSKAKLEKYNVDMIHSRFSLLKESVGAMAANGMDVALLKTKYPHIQEALDRSNVILGRELLGEMEAIIRTRELQENASQAKQLWEEAESRLVKLKKAGLKPVKAEILLRAAEIKLRSDDVESALSTVKRAYKYITEADDEFMKRNHLKTLVEVHSSLKMLERKGIDTSVLEERLMAIKNRIEEGDFKALKALFDNLEKDIADKKRVHLRNSIAGMLDNTERRIEDLRKEDFDLEDVDEMVEDALRLINEDDLDGVRDLLKRIDSSLDIKMQRKKVPVLKERMFSIESEIKKWRNVSMDTSTLEELLSDARASMEKDNIEKASKDVKRAWDIAQRLKGTYQQERILELISESKVIFPELLEAGQDIELMKKELDRVIDLFEAQRYRAAFELSDRVRSMIKSKTNILELFRKLKALREKCRKLGVKGKDILTLDSRLRGITDIFKTGRLDEVRKGLFDIEVDIENEYVSHYWTELDQFRQRLDELTDLGIDVDPLRSFIEKARSRLEKNDHDNAASCISMGWERAKKAYENYISNDLLGKLYDMEDELFDISQLGENVLDMEMKLLEIKRSIGDGAFEKAKTLIERRRADIDDLITELEVKRVCNYLDSTRSMLNNYEIQGLDTEQLAEALVRLDDYYKEGNIKDAKWLMGQMDEICSDLSKALEHKNVKEELESLRREIAHISSLDFDTTLMKTFYEDAKEMFSEGSLDKVKEYCGAAFREARERRREYDFKLAARQLFRIEKVLDFIKDDSQGSVDLADYYGRLDQFKKVSNDKMDDIFVEEVSKLETDIQSLNRDYIKKKAYDSRSKLNELLNYLQEKDGVADHILDLKERADIFLEKEYYDSSIQTYNKAIDSAFSIREKIDLRESLENLSAEMDKASIKGINVKQPEKIVKRVRELYQQGDIQSARSLFESAQNMLDKAKTNYLKSRIKNRMTAVKIYYNELVGLGIPKSSLNRAAENFIRCTEEIKKENWDMGEKLIAESEMHLDSQKYLFNIDTLNKKLEAAVYICIDIEREGVKIAKAKRLLEDMRELLRGREGIDDEEFESISDNIEHALTSAREREHQFRLSRLEIEMEKAETLIDRYQTLDIDMTGPQLLLKKAWECFNNEDTKRGLILVAQSLKSAQNISDTFFKTDSQNLIRELNELMDRTARISGEIDHLRTTFEKGKRLYHSEEYEECTLKLRSLKGICQDLLKAHDYRSRIEYLKTRLLTMKKGKESYLRKVEYIEKLMEEGDFEGAGIKLEETSREIKREFEAHRRKHVSDTIKATRRKVKELGSGGIDQSSSFRYLQKAILMLEEGNLEGAEKAARESLENAVKTRNLRGSQIKAELIGLERAVLNKAKAQKWGEEPVVKLSALLKSMESADEHDLTKIMLIFQDFMEVEEKSQEKWRFDRKLLDVKDYFYNLSPLLPRDIAREIYEQIEKITFIDGKSLQGKGRLNLVNMDDVKDRIIKRTENLINRDIRSINKAIDQMGGVRGLKQMSIEGIEAFEFYSRELDNIPIENQVSRLKVIRSLKELTSMLGRRAMKVALIQRHEKLKMKYAKLSFHSALFVEMDKWLDKADHALGENDVHAAKKHLDKADESLKAAKKMQNRKKARTILETTISEMKRIGVSLERAPSLRDMFSRTKQAAKDGDVSQVRTSCEEMVYFSKELIKRKERESARNAIQDLDAVLSSRSDMVDEEHYRNELNRSERKYSSGDYRYAYSLANKAMDHYNQSMNKYMSEKLQEKYKRGEALVRGTRNKGIDVSQAWSLLTEGRRCMERGEWDLSKELLAESIMVTKQLIRWKNISDMEKESPSWEEKIRALALQGAGTNQLRTQHSRILSHLGNGDLELAMDLKASLIRDIEVAGQGLFKKKIKENINECERLMFEISSFNGDISELKVQVDRSFNLMNQGEVEISYDITKECIEMANQILNGLLRTKAGVIVEATREIIEESRNPEAKEAFVKAKKYYEKGEFRQALELAQDAMRMA